MSLIIILGVVVLAALLVLGFLFFMLDKEGQINQQEEKAVPLTDLSQLKRELSGDVFVSETFKSVNDPEATPAVFTPQAPLPTQASIYLSGDDIYKKRAQELEEELLGVAKKAEEKSNEARQIIETLSQENESLKAQQANLIQAQQKLDELQTEADRLHTENSSLQAQLDLTNANMKHLQEEMAAVKTQMGEEIAQAHATVAQLNLEKESLLAVSTKVEDDALLKKNYEDLEKTNLKLNELNTHLTQKVDLLQYESVKARAQSSGLERITFNYKNQIEDFFKKINAVQLTNDQLSQDKNRLEGLVEEVKSKLSRLEQEYEDFKVRVQQKNQ